MFRLGEVAKQGVEVVGCRINPRGLLNDPFVDVLADRLKAEIEKMETAAQAARSMKNLMKGILLPIPSFRTSTLSKPNARLCSAAVVSVA